MIKMGNQLQPVMMDSNSNLSLILTIIKESMNKFITQSGQ